MTTDTSANPPPWFGGAVAIAGDLAAVGAPGYADQGAVYVFERTGTSWVEEKGFPAGAGMTDGTGTRSTFGNSVALTRNYLAVGASNWQAGENECAGCGRAFASVRAETTTRRI